MKNIYTSLKKVFCKKSKVKTPIIIKFKYDDFMKNTTTIFVKPVSDARSNNSTNC